MHLRKATDRNFCAYYFHPKSKEKNDWLAIMTTDMTLNSQEIVKLYGIRWDIETFFKVSKSLLKLAKETQTRNFNGLICHTTIVFIRYIIRMKAAL
ncbi:transposase [Enterococcus sp. AZ194]|uniref:transposase n=1 Tax=Enterococcus sp. AZ194 TaxID=2774629 RepID=UPI003F682752